MKQTTVRKNATQYRRLPGRGIRREGVSALFVRIWGTLWLAEDHILSVDSRLFSEDYKRFYFRDIQAIAFAKTRRGMVWNIIVSVLMFLFLLPAFRVEDPIGITLWLIVSGIFGLLLVINILRGPTCTCYLLTAVHKEILPSLDRIKKAEKVTQLLRSSIEKAQKDINQ